jgi:hypothetical protein
VPNDVNDARNVVSFVLSRAAMIPVCAEKRLASKLSLLNGIARKLVSVLSSTYFAEKNM